MLFRKDNHDVINGGTRGSGVPSLISVDLHIRGDVVSLSELHIDGVLEGEVVAHKLTIGAKAEVRGAVLGTDVVVRGRVVGNIRAKRLHLLASAHVQGDLEHESLSVEAGAHLDGSCRHLKEGINLPPIIEERLARKKRQLPPPRAGIENKSVDGAMEYAKEDPGVTPVDSATGQHVKDGSSSPNDKAASSSYPLSSC